MGSLAFLYATAPDMPTADKIASALVESRLAACVNILPGVASIYRWKGAVEHASEVAMIVKTSAARAKEAAAKLKALHPYETPAISEIIPGSATDPDFAKWVLMETGS